MAAIYGLMALLGLPLWLPAALALFWALRAPGKLRPVWRLANPYAFAAILLVLLGAMSIPASLLLFSALGCEGGLIDPVTCTHATSSLGIFLDSYTLICAAVLGGVGLPSLALSILAEIITRRRA